MATRIPEKVSPLIEQKFERVNETFRRAVKDNPKDRIEIEIGDSKQPDFKPQVKIMRWDNEVNFSMRAEEHPDAVLETNGKVINYKTPDYEVHQYELDPGDIGEDRGLEFEWVLPKKPSSNVLTATIQTKELDFFYQPPLTQEEIDQGAERPENVVGSYAVYHKTKGGMNRADGMEYKTGKAFHIYRPKVKDANGVETWGELNIDEEGGLLSVTVPQEFLGNAAYPVLVDPTFGYTSAGGSSSSVSANIAYGSRLNSTASSDGEVDSVHMYGSNTGNMKGFVTNSSLNILSDGVTPALSDGGANGWKTMTYTTKPSLVNGSDYYPFFIGNSNGTFFFDSGAGNGRWADTSNSYSTPTNPTDASTSTARYSVYATYTAGGGGGGAPAPTGYMTTNTKMW